MEYIYPKTLRFAAYGEYVLVYNDKRMFLLRSVSGSSQKDINLSFIRIGKGF